MTSLTFDLPNRWNNILFRYLFVFFTLIIFPFPLNIIPGSEVVFDNYNDAWTAIINFTGNILVGLEEPLELSFTGSGDKLYDWLWYASVIGLTLIIGTAFNIIDFKRANYETLKKWFLLFVCYYLAYYMFVYGIIKLFYLQFGPPSMERLFQTFGQASPMRLMWTFMGFSQTYTVFAGASETVGGLLLLFRRTRTLGGLVAAGVMFNVFMMNMSFDIPVKLFSFQLMLIGFYVASQDAGRLINFFLLNRDVPPAKMSPLVHTVRAKWILLGCQVLFAGYVFYDMTSSSLERQKQYGHLREKSTLYGVYNVNTFLHNGDTLPPLLTDEYRWKRLLLDYPSFSTVVHMNDHVTRYQTKIDTAVQTITFSEWGDTVNFYDMKYTLLEDTLRVNGVLMGDTLNVQLINYDMDRFGLLNRGFNWVNEVPYNRYNYD